jgi:hypothetical protein
MDDNEAFDSQLDILETELRRVCRRVNALHRELVENQLDIAEARQAERDAQVKEPPSQGSQ